MDRAARFQQIKKTRQERDTARRQAAQRQRSLADPLLNLVNADSGSDHSQAHADAYQRQAQIQTAESRAAAVISGERNPVVHSLDIDADVKNPIDSIEHQYRNQDIALLEGFATAKIRRTIESSSAELKTCFAATNCFQDCARTLTYILRKAEHIVINQNRKDNEILYFHQIEPPRRPTGEDGKLVAEILTAVENNITSLEAAFYAEEPALCQAATELFSFLLMMGDEMQQRLANAVAAQHATQLTELGKSRSDYSFAQIIGYSKEETADRLRTELTKKLLAGEFDPYQVKQVLRNEMSEAMPQTAVEQARKQIRILLQSYGMNYDQLLPIWHEAAPAHWPEAMVALRNVKAIYELEQIQPGASARLYKRFGIAIFDRYPTEVLVDQDAHADDKDIPYGTATYARKDQGFMEGAMYEAKPVLQSIAAQLKELGFHLRIIEVSGPMSLAKRHIALDHDYGDHQLMSFGLPFAHGERDSIGFGRNEAGQLQIKHLDGRTAQRVLRCYEPQAEISVISCSTGKEGGIIQTLSDKATQQFTAPDRPVTLYRSDAIVSLDDEGLPHFQINFGGGSQNTFNAGKLNNTR